MGDSKGVVDGVLDGSLHIGFVGKRVKKSGITSCRWVKDKIVTIANSESQYNIIDASIMSKIPIILRNQGSATREVLLEHLKDKWNVSINDLNVVMEANGTEGVISAVEANLGISFLSEVAALRAEKNGWNKKLLTFPLL